MAKILLSLPDDLLRKLDEHCAAYSYERSEFVRSLIRTKVFGEGGGSGTGPILETPDLPDMPVSFIKQIQEVRAEIGNEVANPTVKSAKRGKNGYCPHMMTGYCRKCAEGG